MDASRVQNKNMDQGIEKQGSFTYEKCIHNITFNRDLLTTVFYIVLAALGVKTGVFLQVLASEINVVLAAPEVNSRYYLPFSDLRSS